MKIAALILGIFGSIAGFIGALLVLFIAGAAGAFEVKDANIIYLFGVLALLMSVVALIGASLVFVRPTVAAWFMLVSAVLGLIFGFGVAYILATILLIIASVFSFIAGAQEPETLPQGKQVRIRLRSNPPQPESAPSNPPQQQTLCYRCRSVVSPGVKFCGTCGMPQHQD